MPTFGVLNLQDDVIITESIQYRSMAERILNTTAISRRSGNKFLSEDFGQKVVSFKGHIISPSTSGLLGIIDNVQRYLAIPEQTLQIDTGRAYIATCSRANISEMNYTQSVVPFEFEFVSSSPFTLGNNKTAVFTIPSGLLATTITTTISGTAYIEPILTLDYLGNSGDSGVTGVQVSHTTTGQQVTISGAFDRGLSSVFNYEDATVTTSGLYQDYTGSFSRWDTGSNTFEINLSGSNNFGIDGQIEYRPRFYH